MPAEKRSRRERERRDGVVNSSSQVECNEDYRVFSGHKKLFLNFVRISEEGKWLLRRCRKCNRLVANGAKALLCSWTTVMSIAAAAAVIVAAEHRQGSSQAFFHLLLTVLRRLCFIMVYSNFCSRELFFPENTRWRPEIIVITADVGFFLLLAFLFVYKELQHNLRGSIWDLQFGNYYNWQSSFRSFPLNFAVLCEMGEKHYCQNPCLNF